MHESGVQNELDREFLDACRRGNLAEVQAACNAGAYTEIRGEQRESGLHLAAAAKPASIELLDFLVDEIGLNVNAKDSQEQTPAHWAAFADNADALTFLHSRGADLSLRNQPSRLTPEQLAEYKGHTETLATLRQHVADAAPDESLGSHTSRLLREQSASTKGPTR